MTRMIDFAWPETNLGIVTQMNVYLQWHLQITIIFLGYDDFGVQLGQNSIVSLNRWTFYSANLVIILMDVYVNVYCFRVTTCLDVGILFKGSFTDLKYLPEGKQI